METFVGAIFALLFLFVMQLLVMNATERTRCLQRWRPVLMLIALVWWGTPFLKKTYVDDFFYPDDSVVHEGHARDIAYLIGENDWEQLQGYWGLGNEGYRCLMGAFYSVTGAPEVTIYEIHALLAFWGLLCLLEMACAHTQASRAPLWLILFCLLNPSALFWTTFNLKEGAMLWGLCMMLRAAVNLSSPDDRHSRNTQQTDSLFWPAAGLLVAFFLRPHVVVAYLAALGIGVAVRRGEAGWAVVAAAGMVAGVASLQIMAPGLYDSLIADGISVTLNDKFDELSSQGGSGIVYARGAPIPLVSGFILLSARPFPWEASDLQSLAAGIEVWVMMAIAGIGWLTLRERTRLLVSSYNVTLFVAFLALSFYFTYIYNMGLMVRQRVMVFPTMISFAILPYLAATARTQLDWSAAARKKIQSGPVRSTLPSLSSLSSLSSYGRSVYPQHEQQGQRPHLHRAPPRTRHPHTSRPTSPISGSRRA